MPQCPACNAILDQDFGMITCGQCKAVLMVELTGEVHMGSEVSPSENTANDGLFNTTLDDDVTEPPEAVEESYTEPNDFEELRTLDSEVENTDPEVGFSEDTGLGEDSGYDPIEDDLESVIEGDFFENEIVAEDPLKDDEYSVETNEEFSDEELIAADMNSDEDFESLSPVTGPSDEEENLDDATVFEEELVEEFPLAAKPDPNPVDISNYANSEASNLEDGELLYDVKISRLDSKDLKESLKYVLIDEKLKLNYHEYLKNIRDGEVTIPNLNPIKAKRIVEQLQYLDISIEWTQKRVVMETIEPEIEEGEEEAAEDANI